MLRTIATDRYGFRLTVAEDYAYLLDGTSLDSLFARAARLPLPGGKMNKQITEVRLPDGLQVHAKYWAPPKASRMIRSLWRPNKIDREAQQYIRWQGSGLPVARFVLSAVRRLPFPAIGVYMTGFLATRSIEGGRSLRELLRGRRVPWVADGRDRSRQVLESVAQVLATVHKRGLAHGEFALRNVLYTTNHGEPRYGIVDLASAMHLPESEDGHYDGRLCDLIQMALSVARNGLTLSHALQFLESYLQAWDGRGPWAMTASELL